jgi:ligand-binding sensor domain-containing protein
MERIIFLLCKYTNSGSITPENMIYHYIVILLDLEHEMIKNFFFSRLNLLLSAFLICTMVGMRNGMPDTHIKNTPGGQSAGEKEQSDIHDVDSTTDLKNVNTILVDSDNTKWFCSEGGIASYDGKTWNLYAKIKDIPVDGLNGLSLFPSDEHSELWIASSYGATRITFPLDDTTGTRTLTPENSDLFGKEVISIAAGKNSIRWFGTEKGISALNGRQWLVRDYDIHYPEELFQGWPITRLATNPEGDSLYAATAGAGIARVYRDEVDAISGASLYAQWGPIILPSDNIYSLYIALDGVQWFGTDAGIARHSGYNTLENWTAYTTEDGLVDNFVQAICGDGNGNLWIGTRGGISVFNGSSWISYTTDNGLASNQILSIAIDQDGVVWIGMDQGISCFMNGEFTNY